MRAARDAGDREQAVLALRVLVFGHWDRVVRRVALRVPASDVEAVASDVVFSAVRSAFDGSSVGEFVQWLGTITARRIADFHRGRADAPRMVTLAGAGAGAEDSPPAQRGIDVADPAQDGLVESSDAVERVLDSLSAVHARAVERHVLAGVPARSVADELGLGEDNVAQIASRFRRRLRAALETESPA